MANQVITPQTNGARSTLAGYRAVEELISAQRLRYADCWFTDLPGRNWRITMPAEAVNEHLFLTGLPLDGQPVGGAWNGVMLLVPQVDSVYQDPVASAPTLAMLCDLLDPSTQEPLVLEPRHVLKRAEAQVSIRLGATVAIGAEPEFILIEEGGRVAREDMLWEYLRTFGTTLSESGIQVDWFRTGPAAGQGRVQMHAGPPCQMADRVMLYRHTAASLARRRRLTAAFLPKPFKDGGTPAMPMHHTLWKDGQNLFHDEDGWALTSELCRWYAGGILAHMPALLALCAPTTNSYRRLIPGSGPTEAMLSTTRKTAACRIPARSATPGARRIKFWGADSMANPYLAFAAVIMAGLDGIERQIEPPVDGAPMPKARFPHCLESALDALDEDRGFLTGTGVFSDALIDVWITERWASQVLPVRSHPHPWELANFDPFGHPGGLTEDAA